MEPVLGVVEIILPVGARTAVATEVLEAAQEVLAVDRTEVPEAVAVGVLDLCEAQVEVHPVPLVLHPRGEATEEEIKFKLNINIKLVL